MGMTYTSFGAPVTTKNLQANADLNLGNYDLICTDAKGDTAEFSEFVGGVGNFDSALVRGNTQIDGNIVLDGAINNVNINSDGEITTAQPINANGGVNGSVNGVELKQTINVSYSDNTSEYEHAMYGQTGSTCVLPILYNTVYSGKILLLNGTLSSSQGFAIYRRGMDTTGWYNGTLGAGGQLEISFENITALYMRPTSSNGLVLLRRMILS